MEEKCPPEHSQPALDTKEVAQEIVVSFLGPFVGPKQLLGSIGAPGYVLNKPIFEPQKGRPGAGLICRGLLCLGVGIIP